MKQFSGSEFACFHHRFGTNYKRCLKRRTINQAIFVIFIAQESEPVFRNSDHYCILKFITALSYFSRRLNALSHDVGLVELPIGFLNALTQFPRNEPSGFWNYSGLLEVINLFECGKGVRI